MDCYKLSLLNEMSISLEMFQTIHYIILKNALLIYYYIQQYSTLQKQE